MSFDPQIAMFATISSGVGYLMVVAGLHKNALEWRRRRTCPSCGRVIGARVCTFCAGS